MKISNESMRLFKIASRSNATVLLTGATGSGKTSLAREIHLNSARRDKPFVTVNLASVHAGTIESELFGHERGSFTGADQKRTGKLESAQGGTVFLDEIGELSPQLQAKLLDFLQSRTISPMGGNREIRLNVRVIAATHRDLDWAVKRGEFREDLFHRLRVIAIELKPLRERSDEFDEIVHKMIAELCRATDRKILRISEEVAEELETHPWPGNFRELRNVLEFAVNASEGDEIAVSDLPPWFFESKCEKRNSLLVAEDLFELPHSQSMALFEKEYLLRKLRRNRGRINHTARQIGMNKTTLIRRMRAYCLTPDGIFEERGRKDPTARVDTGRLQNFEMTDEKSVASGLGLRY